MKAPIERLRERVEVMKDDHRQLAIGICASCDEDCAYAWAEIALELGEALESVMADLEHEEPDGWMSGHVSVSARRAGLTALAKAAEWL